MAKTKIREDSHGVYVRTNGSVYRPQNSEWCYDTVCALKGVSMFSVGAAGNVKNLRYTPYAQVSVNNHSEIWYSHGCYYDKQGKIISSELVWSPK